VLESVNQTSFSFDPAFLFSLSTNSGSRSREVMKLQVALTFLFLAAAAANWRHAVREALDTDSCEYRTLKMIEVQIDSELLQKMNDGIAVVGLAGDLQQHRRLPGLPQDLSELLDRKAKRVGKAGASVMKS
jgi:hypothetical protein